MRRLLTTRAFVERYGERLREACTRTAVDLDPLLLPQGHLERLEPDALAQIEVACFIGAFESDPALIAALHAGRLAGAYLDVFAAKPSSADSPLWDFPNVLISPHNSSASSGNAARVGEIFFRNLERWMRGEPLENEVGR